jgi:ATP/maltotriose-dependent transcriptional regulator MalT
MTMPQTENIFTKLAIDKQINAVNKARYLNLIRLHLRK